MKMNPNKQKGYDFIDGAIKCLAEYAMIGAVVFALLRIFQGVFGYGTDSTDQDPWNRSGLRLHKDAATGIEYLSTPSGGIIVRGEVRGVSAER